MKYTVSNTLAYYNSAPQLHRYNLRDIPTSVFAAATKAARAGITKSHPTTDAVRFYCLNHLSTLIKKQFTLNEPLPDWAVEVNDKYLETMLDQTNRMFHYIVSICVREMRHLQHTKLSAAWWQKCTGKYGSKASEYLKKIAAHSGETQAVELYMNNPPDLPIGPFMEAIDFAYNEGGKMAWHGGYGGKAWGTVSTAGCEFLKGALSLEGLVDTGFTLAHNNGPIFNKGMFYESYDGNLIVVLDIQRSGQVPELLLDDSFTSVANAELKTLIQKVWKHNPHAFRGWVDWFQVTKMGGVGTYTAQQQKQKQLHPDLPEPKVVEVVTPTGQKEFNQYQQVGTWAVAPGVVVPKFERTKLEGVTS